MTKLNETRPVVQNGGLFWTVISRNERSITHEGQHFFACRCNSRTPWRLIEAEDDPLGRTVRTFARQYQLYELSHAVRHITGGLLDAHPSVNGSATMQQLDDAMASRRAVSSWPFPTK